MKCSYCQTEIERYIWPKRFDKSNFCSKKCQNAWQREVRVACIKHGCARRSGQTQEHKKWESMHSRCRNSSTIGWANYGGRGIKVCSRWTGNQGFENFLKDMGKCPTGMTLDRKDNDGNYEPDNCRWSDRSTQNLNRYRKKDIVCPKCNHVFKA